MEDVTQKTPDKVDATHEVYDELQKIYDYFNANLFDNKLPGALLVMTRKKHSKGHYGPGRYTNKGGLLADEISLNPALFAVTSIEEVLSTLAHEMVHQWQFHFGSYAKAGYHNLEFSNRMEEIGLITSDTGYPGGNRVGERMTHYIAEDGKFIVLTRQLLESNFGIMWYDRYPINQLARPPSPVDVQAAVEQRKMVDAEVSKLKTEKGIAKSNRGRKKTPIIQVAPAAVSKPEIEENKAVSKAIGADIVEIDLVDRLNSPDLASRTAARIVKRQEASVKAGRRVKYTCPSCKDNLWGKAELNIICGREGCNQAKFSCKAHV